MSKFKDLSNQTFGQWKVLNDYKRNKSGNICWLCECQCKKKTTKYVRSSSLISGTSTSCSCERHRKYNQYDLSGEYGIGYLSNSDKTFLFDLEDYDKIKEYCWRLFKGYVITHIGKPNVSMHRLILNPPDNMQVDHIYHNTLDNRKKNLRIVTNKQNTWNRKIKGVSYDKSNNKWMARLRMNGKYMLRKRFKTEEEAINARREAEKKYFGEFAYKEQE